MPISKYLCHTLLFLLLTLGSLSAWPLVQAENMVCHGEHCVSSQQQNTSLDAACLLTNCCVLVVDMALLLWRLRRLAQQQRFPLVVSTFRSHATLPLLPPPKFLMVVTRINPVY